MGIAKGGVVIRSASNLAVLGAKPKGVAAAGAVRYRAPVVAPAAGWRLLDSATNSAATTSPAIDTRGAGLLLVHIATYGTDGTIISDTYGNSWSDGLKTTQGPKRSTTWYVFPPPKTGANHTVTINGQLPTIQWAAFAVPDGFVLSDAGAANYNDNRPGQIALPTRESMVITAISYDWAITSVADQIAGNAGFTMIGNLGPVGSSSMAGALAYYVPPAPGVRNVSPIWTVTAGGTGATQVLAFSAWVF